MSGDLTRDERLAQFDTLRAEGRIARGTWTGHDSQGRETACLLAALASECGKASSAAVCPAEVMPAWLAHLTPWIDDAGSDAAWPGVIDRYAALAHRWHALTPEDWRTLDYRVRTICVREAMRHTTETKVVAVCETVASLCESAGSGETVSKAQWEAWAAAAWAAARAARAAWAAARAAEAAADRLIDDILSEIERTIGAAR